MDVTHELALWSGVCKTSASRIILVSCCAGVVCAHARATGMSHNRIGVSQMVFLHPWHHVRHWCHKLSLRVVCVCVVVVVFVLVFVGCVCVVVLLWL